MTDDLLKEEDNRLLLFSVSSDGDLRGWAFNPDNVRISACFSLLAFSVDILYNGKPL